MMWWVVALVVFLLGGVALVLLLELKRLRTQSETSLQYLQQQVTGFQSAFHQQLMELSKVSSDGLLKFQERVDERLRSASSLVQNSQNQMGNRLEKNAELFAQVKERLAQLDETGKRIQSVGEDISKLQDILRAPKLRGNLGELFLEELLSQILPPSHFEMQYCFSNGEKVDAIIRLAQGHLVPIDAKFPLENFRRSIDSEMSDDERRQFRKTFAADFRKHVDAIASKYIRPEEGTLDFALLYIPAENVYYETILRDESAETDRGMNTYALKRRVIPVSPNSFYAYLQAIALGLRGMRVEERAKEILGFIRRCDDELIRLQGELELVGKHLNNAVGAHEKTGRRLGKLQGQMSQISDDRTLEAAAESPAAIKTTSIEA